MNTSAECFHQIESEGLLKGLQLRVFRTLVNSGAPMTAGEIALAMNCRINSVSSRPVELERLGVIRLAGERKCGVTGRKAVTYEPTNELPKQVEPCMARAKRTVLHRECEAAKAKVIQLQQEMREECEWRDKIISDLRATLGRWGRISNQKRRERQLAGQPAMLL